MKPIDISIIILCKNEEQNIGKCLDGMFNQKVNLNYEVIVIDSGSTDRTLAILRNYPICLFEIKPEEFNHGKTRQYGVEVAKGEYIVYIVADAYPEDEYWLENLLKNFKYDEKVAGVYGRQIPKPDCDPFLANLMNNCISGKKDKLISYIDSQEDYQALTPWQKREMLNFEDISSARSRKALSKFPLPEAIYAEDQIWAKNVIEAGYKLIYEPDVGVYHSHKPGIMYYFKRKFYDQKLSTKFYGLKLFRNAGEFIRAFIFEAINFFKISIRSEKKILRKLKWLLYSPFLSFSQTAGGILGVLSETKDVDLGRFDRFLKRCA